MLTRQTWAAAISAVVFVVMAAILALSSVPFVSWAPGGTHDVLGERDGSPVIQVSGVPTYDTPGQLSVTTLSVTRAEARLSLPEALLFELLPDREVLPRTAVYPAGQSAEDIQQSEVQQMATSQRDAIVAALRAANVPVVERPMASVIVNSGPSSGKLKPGDLVVAVDHYSVATVADVRSRIESHKIGDVVLFSILRDRVPMDVTVVTQASNTSPTAPVVGVGWDTGYSYDADITINLDPAIGGPSGGLILALGLYDKITPGALIGNRSVAGSGEISTAGKVGAIGAIREKIAGAQAAGATIFLVPDSNCDSVVGVQTSMKLVKVSTLSDAIAALTLSEKDPNATLPSCNG